MADPKFSSLWSRLFDIFRGTGPRPSKTKGIAFPQMRRSLVICAAFKPTPSQLAENYGSDTNSPSNAIKEVVPVNTMIEK